MQQICDGLTDQKIYRFAGKWLARLPHPFTREDEQADYCWQLSVQQAEFSTTMALDLPVAGRIFFEQLIRDNIDIGRPDKVNIVFDRKIRLRGKNPTPGTFRTSPLISTTCTRIPGMRFPTRASRPSWAPAAHSRSGPPASPVATCGTTSPPARENARGHDQRPDHLRLGPQVPGGPSNTPGRGVSQVAQRPSPVSRQAPSRYQSRSITSVPQ